MYRLVRITSADYRDYRRTRAKVEYSFFPIGKEIAGVAGLISKMTESEIPGKGEFLDLMEQDKNAFYFLKDDDEIKGIAELIFNAAEQLCDIREFAVLQHGEGLGTILYQEVLKVIKERKATKIVLWCPFAGAQIFWRKMGFGVKQSLGGNRGFIFGKRV